MSMLHLYFIFMLLFLFYTKLLLVHDFHTEVLLVRLNNNPAGNIQYFHAFQNYVMVLIGFPYFQIS